MRSKRQGGRERERGDDTSTCMQRSSRRTAERRGEGGAQAVMEVQGLVGLVVNNDDTQRGAARAIRSTTDPDARASADECKLTP